MQYFLLVTLLIVFYSQGNFKALALNLIFQKYFGIREGWWFRQTG
jgi:hypothetical protein